jgi:hypothetical protein
LEQLSKKKNAARIKASNINACLKESYSKILNCWFFLCMYSEKNLSFLPYEQFDVIERAADLELEQFGFDFQLCLQFQSNLV